MSGKAEHMAKAVVDASAEIGEIGPATSRKRAGFADVEIGQRIRRMRASRRMSQDQLAERLGISCQQVQKYESGGNRISASRLVEVARELNVAVGDLLVDPDVGESAKLRESINHPELTRLREPTAAEFVELVCLYADIRNPEARTKVLYMVRFFARLGAK